MALGSRYLGLSPIKKVLFAFSMLIVVLVLCVVALEMFSSYTVSKSVNETAPVRTKQSVTIKAPAEKVFVILQNVNSWPAWQKDIPSSRINGAFQPGATFEWKTGGLSIHSTLHTVKRSRHIGWSGTAFGAFAIHNWAFTEQNGYTTVTVEESMEGWLVEVMENKFQKGLDAGTKRWLNYLKQRAEE